MPITKPLYLNRPRVYLYFEKAHVVLTAERR